MSKRRAHELICVTALVATAVAMAWDDKLLSAIIVAACGLVVAVSAGAYDGQQ